MFESYLRESIVARALKRKIISFSVLNPRDLTVDKHRTVDGRPYGGGPGMVLRAEPIAKAVKKILTKIARRKNPGKTKVLIMSAAGKPLTNKYADSLIAKYDDIVMISGRYEGIDARVKKMFRAEEVNIGPYVLTGGELPAMVIIDVITRRLPGVLGKDASVEERRVSSSEVYTRPEVLEWEGKKYRVPKVLLSGHHGNIDGWKEQ